MSTVMGASSNLTAKTAAQPHRPGIGSKSYAETVAKPPPMLEVKRQATVFLLF